MSGRGFGHAFDARAALAGPRKRRRSSAERFWARVNKNGPVVRTELGPCWEWTGRRNDDGYGIVSWCGVDVATHRVAYSLKHGPIAAGEVIRHDCDNPACCNPSHLRPGDIGDNNRDLAARGRHRHEHIVQLGVDNPLAKLDDESVIAMRACWLAGESIKSIVRRTGLAAGTIHPMLYGRTWAHVPVPPEIVQRRQALEARAAGRD